MVDIVRKKLDELTVEKELLLSSDDSECIATELAEFEAMQARDFEEFRQAQITARAEKARAINEKYATDKAQKLHDIDTKIDFARSLVDIFTADNAVFDNEVSQ